MSHLYFNTIKPKKITFYCKISSKTLYVNMARLSASHNPCKKATMHNPSWFP